LDEVNADRSVPLLATVVKSKRVKAGDFFSDTAGGNSARKFLAHANQVEVEREMTTGA
jgi:hypothetical protein